MAAAIEATRMEVCSMARADDSQSVRRTLAVAQDDHWVPALLFYILHTPWLAGPGQQAPGLHMELSPARRYYFVRRCGDDDEALG